MSARDELPLDLKLATCLAEYAFHNYVWRSLLTLDLDVIAKSFAEHSELAHHFRGLHIPDNHKMVTHIVTGARQELAEAITFELDDKRRRRLRYVAWILEAALELTHDLNALKFVDGYDETDKGMDRVFASFENVKERFYAIR